VKISTAHLPAAHVHRVSDSFHPGHGHGFEVEEDEKAISH
jgi:hypothetical protein